MYTTARTAATTRATQPSIRGRFGQKGMAMRYRAGSWMAAGVLAATLCQPAFAHCNDNECAWWQNGAYGGCGGDGCHGTCPALVWVKSKIHHFFYMESPYPGCCPTEYQRYMCRQYYQHVEDYYDGQMHYAGYLKHQVGVHRCVHSACGDCGSRGGSPCAAPVGNGMLPGYMDPSVAGQFAPGYVPRIAGQVETVGHHSSLR
jgi:hypothetical protein